MIAALTPSAGAIAETEVSGSLASVLWRHSERKGIFSQLEPQARAVLREKGLWNASNEIANFSDTGPGTLTRRRPDACVHDSSGLLFW